MLPMTLQFLVVMIASAIIDRMQRKLDYLEEENRVLHEQLDAITGGRKVSFSADQRRRLAIQPERGTWQGCLPLTAWGMLNFYAREAA